MSKSLSESKYVTTTIINGTATFALGVIVNGALLWLYIVLLGPLFIQFLHSLNGHKSFAVTVYILLMVLALAICSALAALAVVWVLQRFGRQLSRGHRRQMVMASAVLGVLLGLAWYFALAQTSFSAYFLILALGLPFTLGWLWVTRKGGK